MRVDEVVVVNKDKIIIQKHISTKDSECTVSLSTKLSRPQQAN